MYVIIETERHPQKEILNVFGPYRDWRETMHLSVDMEQSESNLIPGYRRKRSDFSVHEITAR